MYTHNDFIIAPADASTGPAMQALILAILREYDLSPDAGGVDADVLDIEQHYRRGHGEFYVVYRAGQLVATGGFARIDAHTCELRKMYALPQVRGRGLGRFLLTLCEQTARARGFTRMQLETASVLTEAIALYEKNAYVLQPHCPHVARCDRLYAKQL